MTLRPRNYATLPPIPSGYPLDDVWAVLKPIARTNLVTNPSLETNSTNWNNFGATISLNRVSTYQYHGLYCAEAATVSPGDSIGFSSVTLAAGITYAVSCKFFTPAGAGGNYELQVQTTGGVVLSSYRFKASGRWQWVWMYYTEPTGAARRFYVASVNLSNNYYVDGLQVEAIAAGEAVSTYIDGDQQGLVPNQFPIPYGWNGTPHASTSYRTGQSRAGGMVIPFRNYGWFLTAMVGLGLALPQNVATEYARIDGGYDDYTRKPTRQFTLAGQFESTGAYRSLRDQRGQLARLFDRDLVSLDQRLTLMRWIEDECGVIDTSYCRVIAKYQGGLEGNTDNHYASQAPITFTNYLPAVMSDQEFGTALNVQTSVTNINRIALRTPGGVWQAIGTGATGGTVYAVVKGLDGKYYIGGDFTLFGGVANTVRICSYDPVTGTIAALGTGSASGIVLDLQVAPNGNIWAVGTFADMGGVAAADFVAIWNGSAWSAPGTPPTLAGTYLQPGGGAFGADGSFYVAAGTGAPVSKWSGSAWSTIGTAGGGGSNTATSIVRAPDGNIVVGLSGTAPTIGAASGSGVYKYDVVAGTWSGIGAYVQAFSDLEYDPAGRLYGGGGASLWRFSGNAWVQVVTSNNLTGRVAVNPLNSQVFFGGDFTTANSLTPPDSFGIWNGASVLYPDIDLPGTAGTTIITLLKTFSDGTLIVGLNASGTATAGSVTTVTNSGSGRAYPALILKGPSSGTARIYDILNVTTGRALYFNLTINAGETVTMTMQPDNLSFVSDFQGDVTRTILAGSNEADFFLQPGANVIAFLSASATVTATLRWRNGYLSLDDVP
jgi:hypothetical protein